MAFRLPSIFWNTGTEAWYMDSDMEFSLVEGEF
jgi:hypothetical protein